MRKVLYILGQLSDADVDWLAGAGARVRHAKAAELIACGARLDRVFVILDGEVSIRTANGVELARVGAGEILGEMSLVDSRPASAVAVATSDVVVLEIPRAALQGKLDSDIGFAARFYRALAIFLSERMRGTIGRFGYGKGGPEPESTEDELDDTVLDNVHLAGARFEALLRKLAGAPA
jgi:CRP/FNR family transcriptional regulator, cyclic AMP receptor protein